MSAAAAAPARQGRGFFKVIRFDKTVRGSSRALRYVAFRSEDVKGKEPLLFDDRTDNADVKAFEEGLSNRVARHPTAAKAYHTVFSLTRQDFEKAGMTDWREVIREVMTGYERETQRKLHWIASNHDNPKHPHAHVIIRATYTDASGRERKLFLNRREIDRIKELTGRSLEARGLDPDRLQMDRRQERMHPKQNQAARAAGAILTYLRQQLRKHLQQAEQDRERDEIERRRQLEKGDRGR